MSTSGQVASSAVADAQAVPGHSDIFAIGDTALSLAWDGQPVPGLAPAAKQGGAYVASVLRARLRGRKPPPPFRYHHQSSLATIGRRSALADFGRVKVTGAMAWWLWGGVHVFFLVGVRNRLSVMLGWVWSYFRRRSTADHANRSGSICTDIP
jgi:NADH dehydrogenase FAD-containing subunit